LDDNSNENTDNKTTTRQYDATRRKIPMSRRIHPIYGIYSGTGRVDDDDGCRQRLGHFKQNTSSNFVFFAMLRFVFT